MIPSPSPRDQDYTNDVLQLQIVVLTRQLQPTSTAQRGEGIEAAICKPKAADGLTVRLQQDASRVHYDITETKEIGTTDNPIADCTP